MLYKVYLAVCLCCLLVTGSALAEEGGPTYYECAAGNITRQIKSEEHCLAERQATPGLDACRVEYTKDGVTEILWRARHDPSYCYPRVRSLVSSLEESGFSCTGVDRHIECGDVVAGAEEAAAATEPGDDNPPQLLRETYFSDATQSERDYFVYLPGDFKDEDAWPVMLFLHGNGERGDGKSELDYVMVHGPLYEAWVQKRDLPFVIIAPQLPMYDMGELPFIKNRQFADIPWRLAEGTPDRSRKFASADLMNGATSMTPDEFGIEGPPSGWPLHETELLDMVDTIVEKYRGDSQRVYLSGLSYGGFGAWYMASKYPERFAAVNPIVGYPHPELVDSIAVHQLPVWCFAGGRDTVVPVAYFYEGLNRLEQLGHEDVRFTVEEDMNHDVWTRVYAGEDIYNWMLSQSK